MAKFKVKSTRTETYVYEEIVTARNRAAALFEVERRGFEYPEQPTMTEDTHEVEELHE